ncbi:non-specific serine/threonine protein kinase [Plasmodiophora brassicae]|uniref:Protein kinase domain-containing protein n=1 Tax=Plasmodiophora brassicae TaxID=37360 RepID=A0A0G4ISQ9_PLABS|nr:hypothetical protein PBRA_006512 [Plasmodiophora brassicae]
MAIASRTYPRLLTMLQSGALVAIVVVGCLAALTAEATWPSAPPPMPCRLKDFVEHAHLDGYDGRSITYLVRHRKTNVPYAMKKVAKVGDVASAAYTFAERDALLYALRDTPGVVRAYCVMQDADYAYLLREYLPGGNLFDLVYVTHPAYPETSEDTLRFYVASTVLALENVHQMGMFHGLLTPEGVELDANGYIRLVDFMLSRPCQRGDKFHNFQGAVEYVSPELAETRSTFREVGWLKRYDGYDQASDLWSLGIFVCDLFARTTPFRVNEELYADDGQRLHATLRNLLLTTEAAIPCRLPSSLSSEAKAFVLGLLRYNPQERLGFVQIKSHAWFQGFDWDDLATGRMDAPWKPTQLTSAFDTSYFVRKPPQHVPIGNVPRPPYKDDRLWLGL